MATSFETFRPIGQYEQGNLSQKEPSCWNGVVRVRKYRVTVEEIEEPAEVVAERVRKLWRGCDNHHHRTPLEAAAKRCGIELKREECGIDNPRR